MSTAAICGHEPTAFAHTCYGSLQQKTKDVITHHGYIKRGSIHMPKLIRGGKPSFCPNNSDTGLVKNQLQSLIVLRMIKVTTDLQCMSHGHLQSVQTTTFMTASVGSIHVTFSVLVKL